MFAICRGAQLWNIVKGGTLYQHLPDHFDTDIDHYNSNKTQAKDHDVIIEKGSKLHVLLGLKNGNQKVAVNSLQLVCNGIRNPWTKHLEVFSNHL